MQLRGEILNQFRELKELKDADVLEIIPIRGTKENPANGAEWASLNTVIVCCSSKPAIVLLHSLKTINFRDNVDLYELSNLQQICRESANTQKRPL